MDNENTCEFAFMGIWVFIHILLLQKSRLYFQTWPYRLIFFLFFIFWCELGNGVDDHEKEGDNLQLHTSRFFSKKGLVNALFATETRNTLFFFPCITAFDNNDSLAF